MISLLIKSYSYLINCVFWCNYSSSSWSTCNPSLIMILIWRGCCLNYMIVIMNGSGCRRILHLLLLQYWYPLCRADSLLTIQWRHIQSALMTFRTARGVTSCLLSMCVIIDRRDVGFWSYPRCQTVCRLSYLITLLFMSGTIQRFTFFGAVPVVSEDLIL